MTPSEELLSAYLDGELGAQERADVERRLASDSHWRETLEKLQEVRAWMQELPAVVPSRPKSIVQMLAEHKPDANDQSIVRLDEGSNISAAPTSWKWMISLAATSLLLVGTTLWWTSGMNDQIALGPSFERASSDSPPPAARNVGGSIYMQSSDSQPSKTENTADAPQSAALEPAMASKSMPAPDSAALEPTTPVPTAEVPTDPAPAMIASGAAGLAGDGLPGDSLPGAGLAGTLQGAPSPVEAMNAAQSAESGAEFMGGSGGGLGGVPRMGMRSVEAVPSRPNSAPGPQPRKAETSDSMTPAMTGAETGEKDHEDTAGASLAMDDSFISISRFLTEKSNVPENALYFLAEKGSAEEGVARGIDPSEFRDRPGEESLKRRADTEFKKEPNLGQVVHLKVPAEALMDLEEAITVGEFKLHQNVATSLSSAEKNGTAEMKAGEPQTRSAEREDEIWLLEISAANYEALRARWSEKGFDVTEILDDQKLNVVRAKSEADRKLPDPASELAPPSLQPKSNKPVGTDNASRAISLTPQSEFIFILLQRR
jgi:hypothetical protein